MCTTKVTDLIKIDDGLVNPGGLKGVYTLCSFSCHGGASLENGHFYTNRKVSGEWWEHNGTTWICTELPEASADVYMLVYQRSGDDEPGYPPAQDAAAPPPDVVRRRPNAGANDDPAEPDQGGATQPSGLTAKNNPPPPEAGAWVEQINEQPSWNTPEMRAGDAILLLGDSNTNSYPKPKLFGDMNDGKWVSFKNIVRMDFSK